MNITSLFVWVVLFSLATACSSGSEIITNADPTINFHSFTSFAFVQPLGTDKAGYASLVSQQLKTSSRREMEKLGYRYDESNPDLLLNFNAKLTHKFQVSEMPVSGYYGYYGYRAGYYGAWPAYSTRVEQYSEGTLNVDLVDVRRHELVWEGVLIDRVTTQDLKQVGSVIDAAIVAVFAKFPTSLPAPH